MCQESIQSRRSSMPSPAAPNELDVPSLVDSPKDSDALPAQSNPSQSHNPFTSHYASNAARQFMLRMGVSYDDDSSTVIERMARVAHRNYRALAYAVVIGTYVLGFTEYVYLRLTVLVSGPSGSVAQAPPGAKGKDGLHYAIGVAAFFAIGLFQIICFFGLTISEHILQSARERNAAGHQLAYQIRLLISRTIERTFICYGLCSLIVCMIIFYMIGIQDSVDKTASIICVYLFDGFIICYFLCFPLITIMYHPHIHCRRERLPPAGATILPSASNSCNFDPILPSTPCDDLPPRLLRPNPLPLLDHIPFSSRSSPSSPPLSFSPIRSRIRHSAPPRYRVVTTV